MTRRPYGIRVVRINGHMRYAIIKEFGIMDQKRMYLPINFVRTVGLEKVNEVTVQLYYVQRSVAEEDQLKKHLVSVTQRANMAELSGEWLRVCRTLGLQVGYMYQFAARPGHAHIYITRRFREVDSQGTSGIRELLRNVRTWNCVIAEKTYSSSIKTDLKKCHGLYKLDAC